MLEFSNKQTLVDLKYRAQLSKTVHRAVRYLVEKAREWHAVRRHIIIYFPKAKRTLKGERICLHKVGVFKKLEW